MVPFYCLIMWWYKMPGKFSWLQGRFHFWRGEARPFSGAAVMVWWGSSPFFHGSQKDWICRNVTFIPDNWQGKFCISLSVCSFFGLSGPVQRGINERCSQIEVELSNVDRAFSCLCYCLCWSWSSALSSAFPGEIGLFLVFHLLVVINGENKASKLYLG